MIGLNSDYLSQEALRAIGFKSVGERVLIHSTSVLANCERMSIGSDVRIDAHAVISAGEGVTIGNNVHIACQCSLTGVAAVELGDFSSLSQGVRLFSASDDYLGGSPTNPTVPAAFKLVKSAPVRLGRHVMIGSNSVILPGVEIGEGAAVGALALVNRSLEGWFVYAGVPVRQLKARRRDLLEYEKSYFASREIQAKS